MNGTHHLYLFLGWVLWCLLHSLLLTRLVREWLQARLGSWRYHYRLFYNFFAAASLIPLAIATHLLPGELLFSWQGLYQILRVVLIVLAFWLFWDGGRHYDVEVFLGLFQIRKKTQAVSLAADGEFSRRGVHGLCRHPWYLGALLVLWTVLPRYHTITALVAALLTCYLFIGAYLEERRLLGEYGERYRQYQREVSMLIPLQWIYTWLRKRRSMK